MQIDAFFGHAKASEFIVSGDTVAYGGPPERYWRRMLLHYAHLAKLAGGVDAFLVGSELRGLTRVRDEAGGFPGGAGSSTPSGALRSRAILPARHEGLLRGGLVRVFRAHHPADGERRPHLYPLDELVGGPELPSPSSGSTTTCR